MTVRSFKPPQPLTANGAEMARALQGAQVSKTDAIRVAGPAGLKAMLWLCRQGYEQAMFVCSEGVGAQGPADALLIPQACGARELGVLLQAGKTLREGGALIVQLAASETPETVAALLEPLGYRIERSLSHNGRTLLIARRFALAGLRRAA